jgi:predicted nuclease of predicted toxin-antitoxin system
MKLLFDENISYRIVKKLATQPFSCLHVSRTGLGISPTDIDIWQFAKRNDCNI